MPKAAHAETPESITMSILSGETIIVPIIPTIITYTGFRNVEMILDFPEGHDILNLNDDFYLCIRRNKK